MKPSYVARRLNFIRSEEAYALSEQEIQLISALKVIRQNPSMRFSLEDLEKALIKRTKLPSPMDRTYQNNDPKQAMTDLLEFMNITNRLNISAQEHDKYSRKPWSRFENPIGKVYQFVSRQPKPSVKYSAPFMYPFLPKLEPVHRSNTTLDETSATSSKEFSYLKPTRSSQTKSMHPSRRSTYTAGGRQLEVDSSNTASNSSADGQSMMSNMTLRHIFKKLKTRNWNSRMWIVEEDVPAKPEYVGKNVCEDESGSNSNVDDVVLNLMEKWNIVDLEA